MKRFTFLMIILLYINNCFGQARINIESFKVKGHDELDDTSLFDEAIEYISSIGGDIYVPEGIYILNNNKRKRVGVNNNSYIFLVENDFSIILHPNAKLIYLNGFKGFRFRSTKDPDIKTINKYNITIQGGVIDASGNNNYSQKNNPEIWGFVGEYLNSLKVIDLKIKNLFGTAGIASYNNDEFIAYNNVLLNINGNPNDYIDNHGDGIYVSNTTKYKIENNQVNNTYRRNDRLARIGICIEYELSKNGIISSNVVSGYDRGIHIELIQGTATIINNKLEGNISGVVLWNNYNFKQTISNNVISNLGLLGETEPMLYISSPILLLGYNSNNGTEISDNIITIYSEYFLPQNLIQVTSSNIKIRNNKFLDYSRSLVFSVSQGKTSKQRVSNIVFEKNKISTKYFYAYDGSLLNIQNNDLEVEKVILSFDNTTNIYRGNKVKDSNGRNVKVNLYGNYN